MLQPWLLGISAPGTWPVLGRWSLLTLTTPTRLVDSQGFLNARGRPLTRPRVADRTAQLQGFGNSSPVNVLSQAHGRMELWSRKVGKVRVRRGASGGVRGGAHTQVRAAEPRLRACSIPGVSVPAPLGVLSEVGSGGVPGSHSRRLPSRLLPATSSTAPAPATFPPHAAASQRRVFRAVLGGGRDGTTRSGRDAWAWVASVRLSGLSAGSSGGEGREGTRPYERIPGRRGIPHPPPPLDPKPP